MDIYATAVVVILGVGIARVSFEYQSELVLTWWFVFVVFSSGPKLSFVTNSNGPDNGKSCRRRLCLSMVPVLTQRLKLLTVLYTFVDILGQ